MDLVHYEQARTIRPAPMINKPVYPVNFTSIALVLFAVATVISVFALGSLGPAFTYVILVAGIFALRTLRT